MKVVDTNIVLRYLLRDHPGTFATRSGMYRAAGSEPANGNRL